MRSGWYRNYGVCKEKDPKVVSEGVIECTWNGTFRHAYPWTLRFETPAGSPGIESHIKAARVFLNGDLVHTWVAPATGRIERLEILGHELIKWMLPEGAPMDLRIIPHGVEVDKAVLDAKIAERPPQWRRQLEIAADAVATSPSLANGTLKQKMKCIEYRARAARHAALLIAGTTAEIAPVKPDGCDSAADPPKDSLSARYAGLKTKTAAEIDALEARFLEEVGAYAKSTAAVDHAALEKFKAQARDFWDGVGGKGTWWAELDNGNDRTEQRRALLKLLDTYPEARRAIIDSRVDDVFTTPRKVKGIPDSAIVPASRPSDRELVWIQTRGTLDELRYVLSRADDMVTQGLAAIDDTITLQAQLRKDAVRIASSPDEQARLFLRVANSLQSTSPFEQMGHNPELITGERALGMRYSDPWQVFFIAPWTAFPIAPKSGKPDFTAANLFPIIDVVGVRYQWGGSRFGDVRPIALGVTALSFTTPDPKDATKSIDQFRFAPEVSFGLGTLKIGGAIAVGSGMAFSDRWRILVGADLVKLIAGKDLEAITW